MEDNNFLLEQTLSDGNYQLKLKIKYLQDDKQNFEITCQQLKQNIRLLRNINKQLTKTTQAQNLNGLTKLLQEQNTHLETAYLRILQENHSMSCQNLMLSQIVLEGQSQFKQILKGYESKIIELRRSIQFKQSCIQTFQQNANYSSNSYQIGNIPPSNVSMIFFNEIDEYKNSIYLLERNNKQLQVQIESLNTKISLILQQKQHIDRIISTRCGFNEFKNRFNQEFACKRQTYRTEPKQSLLVSLTSQSKNQLRTEQNSKKSLFKQKSSLTETQPHQTRQVSYQCNAGNFKLNQIKQQLKKKSLELQKLTVSYRKQKIQRKQNEQKIKVLISSNKFYKQKRQKHMDELNYYKRATLDLLRLAEKKKVRRNYSLQKMQTDKIIVSIKKPRQLQVLNNNKRFWKQIQCEINEILTKKTQINLGKPNPCKLKRSISNILDYTELCHDDDKVDKYYQLKYVTHTDKANIAKVALKNKFENKDNELQDFSRVLQLGANGQIFGQQSLIIKPRVMSYSQRKKLKARQGSLDANNLTIIRQNVL